jgi:hypothetical protein
VDIFIGGKPDGMVGGLASDMFARQLFCYLYPVPLFAVGRKLTNILP